MRGGGAVRTPSDGVRPVDAAVGLRRAVLGRGAAARVAGGPGERAGVHGREPVRVSASVRTPIANTPGAPAPRHAGRPPARSAARRTPVPRPGIARVAVSGTDPTDRPAGVADGGHADPVRGTGRGRVAAVGPDVPGSAVAGCGVRAGSAVPGSAVAGPATRVRSRVGAGVPDSVGAGAAVRNRGAPREADLAGSSHRMYRRARHFRVIHPVWPPQPTHPRWSCASAYPTNATTSITACAMTNGQTREVSW